MSTDTLPSRIIPDNFFHSIFRNLTNYRLYVWWAGSHGMSIEPGEHFHILGDPRIPPSIPRARGMVDSIRSMIEEGLIEFCSSPAMVVDNNLPDGVSTAMYTKDGAPYLDAFPVAKEDLAARTLPVITPTGTYDPDKNEITVDWSTLTTLELHDTFTVLVIPPKGEDQTVKCGPDKQLRFLAKAGPGDYMFTVTLIALDKRTQEGTEIIVTVPEPIPTP